MKVTEAADVTMAQASNAQREPSMEEILASIRRIIEDGDGAPPVERQAAPQPASGGDIVEVEAFRSELKAVPSEEPKPANPVDMQDVANREADFRPAAPFVESAAPKPEQLAGELHFAGRAPVVEAAPVRAVSAPAAVEPAVNAASRSTIISEQAERQIAAAFGELNDVFAANRRKSFDDVAERMLRPMLQEWLDDNLPGLVERLVREEIERVARGEGY